MKTTVICGAGIAGVATAHYLKKLGSEDRIILIDRSQPLSFTTAASGENFRDYWPQRCMQDFVGHSLDLIRALDDDYEMLFSFKQTGYEFVSEYAAGEMFRAEGSRSADDKAVVNYLPGNTRSYLGTNIEQITQVVQAGSLNVHVMGQYLYSRARASGVETMLGTITGIETEDGVYRLDLLSAGEQESLQANTLILAAGPFTRQLAGYLGMELPVQSYLQRKIVLNDPLSVIPRDMPFTIFADRQYLSWSADEQVAFQADPEFRWLTEEFPAGLHIKPESESQIKLGWAYNRNAAQPNFELYNDVSFPVVVMRGASRFIPGLAQYVENMPTPITQIAGYYTRTEENWPLIGRLKDNCYTVTALSGYGTMAGCAAGQLTAQWVLGEKIPWYGRYFEPMRYQNPELVAEMSSINSDGQL